MTAQTRPRGRQDAAPLVSRSKIKWWSPTAACSQRAQPSPPRQPTARPTASSCGVGGGRVGCGRRHTLGAVRPAEGSIHAHDTTHQCGRRSVSGRVDELEHGARRADCDASARRHLGFAAKGGGDGLAAFALPFLSAQRASGMLRRVAPQRGYQVGRVVETLALCARPRGSVHFWNTPVPVAGDEDDRGWQDVCRHYSGPTQHFKNF